MRQVQDAPVEWAGFRMLPRIAEGHFFMVGAPGSGKSLCLHALMASVLRQIGPESDRRAVFFDEKGYPKDAIEQLKASGVHCPIRRLDPFASDGFIWDIGADWTDTSMVGHYANLLVPGPANSTGDFFVHNARAILQRLLAALMLKGEPWTLGDLLDITSNSDRLRHTLLSAPDAAAVKNLFGPPAAYANSFAVLSTAMETLREVAAATRELLQDRRVRFCEWSKSESSMLVLGTDHMHQTQMTLFNKLMFDTLCRKAIERPASPGRWTTWFFLEDAGTFPDAESLPHLLTMGRASGVRVAFTCQDLERLADVYGSHKAGELAALCANRSIFRLTSPTTAAWAAAITSGVQTFEYRPQRDAEKVIDIDSGNGCETPKSFRPRPPCTPAEFFEFPLAKQGRVYGCHMSPSVPGAVLRETEYSLPPTV